MAAPVAAPTAAALAARARPPLPLPKAELEERIASVQARLRLPAELCCEQAGWGALAPQWHRRDALALLLSREVCGAWAPNGVQPESDEELLLRAFARFSILDGVVCAEDCVMLHALHTCYEAAPSPARGDTRPAHMLDLLRKQRPYVARLLRDYELRGWLADGGGGSRGIPSRRQLEAALLARSRSEYRVAPAPAVAELNRQRAGSGVAKEPG